MTFCYISLNTLKQWAYLNSYFDNISSWLLELFFSQVSFQWTIHLTYRESLTEQASFHIILLSPSEGDHWPRAPATGLWNCHCFYAESTTHVAVFTQTWSNPRMLQGAYFSETETTLTDYHASSPEWGTCWNFFRWQIIHLPFVSPSFIQGLAVPYLPHSVYSLTGISLINPCSISPVLTSVYWRTGNKSHCMVEWQEMGMLPRVFNVNLHSHIACRFGLL